MKLHLSILEKMIDLPTKDPGELRQLLDDLGLEVKGVEETPHGPVFNIETLANRGDHLSALGVARELSARLMTNVKMPAVAPISPDQKASVKLRVTTPLCSRAALLEMVVPKNLQLRPEIAAVVGTTGRHPIVDILNYVLLEIGQPMHTWDREKIDGEICFEESAKEETFDALDGKKYRVPAGAIIGRDRKRIADIAGIIGGADSATTNDTTRVLIVSAAFDPVTVRKARHAMNISTDASYVFERGNDIDAVLFGLQRVAYLVGSAVKESGAAQVVGLTVLDNGVREKRTVPVSVPAIRRELHLPRLNEVEITARLKHLGYALESAGKELTYNAVVPTWRLWDVRNPEDITEDFARSYGLNKIKLEVPPLDYEIPEIDTVEQMIQTIEPALHGNGFFEVITKGFTSNDDIKLLSELDPSLPARHLALKNSLESTYSHLKATNVLHLARLAEWNLRRGLTSVKAYEFGRLFSKERVKDQRFEFEREAITMVMAGRWNDNHWRKAESLDQIGAELHGVLESLCRAAGVKCTIGSSQHRLLHPGLQASVKIGRSECGFFGAIHPLIQKRLGLSERVIYVELECEKLVKAFQPRAFAAPIDLPSVWRDVTLCVKARSLAGEVERIIEGESPADLLNVEVVDDFRRQTEDFRRVTFRLTFQNPERTLESAEVDRTMESLLARLRDAHQLALAP